MAVFATSATLLTPQVPAVAAASASTWDDLSSAVSAGGTVVLGADISQADGSSLTVGAVPVVLDLNGHHLSIDDVADEHAAVAVHAGSSLTIEDDSPGADGSLTATGGYGGAGIGGDGSNGDAGSLTITGGSVTATATDFAAGVGGGIGPAGIGAGGVVIVSGGSLVTTGGDYSAGIGGMGAGTAGSLTVTGGSVSATGGNTGAGVGGGQNGPAGSVIVSGGSLVAYGGSSGAGVGSGALAHGAGANGQVTVSGGTLTATGGTEAAGVGGGQNGPGGSVTVTGGTLTATGGLQGAGVGAGRMGGTSIGSADGGSVIVSGGSLIATGGSSAAGIGGGLAANGASVTVEPESSVTAAGGPLFGSAIGAGFGGVDAGSLSNAGRLTIPTGSTLTVPSGTTVQNTGTIVLAGALTGTGTVANDGSIVGGGSVADDGQGGDDQLLVSGHNYTLRFDTSESDATAPPDLHVYATSVAAAGTALPAGPSRDGYTFTGWHTTGGTQAHDDTDLEAFLGAVGPHLATLHAGYTAVPVARVTFDARGGAPTPADQTVNLGGYVVEPATEPSRTGYAFDGWYTTADTGGDQWNFSTDIVTGDTTLHAHYRTDRPPPVPPRLTAVHPPRTGVVGTPYRYTFAAWGRPAPGFDVRTGTIPDGLSLDSDSGELTGTPTSAGTFTFTVAAHNGIGSDDVSRPITVTIRPALSITTSALPGGTVGEPYAATLATTGGDDTRVNWSLAAGSALPEGLSLSRRGIITGTPAAAGLTTFTVGVDDSAFATLTIVVEDTATAPETSPAPTLEPGPAEPVSGPIEHVSRPAEQALPDTGIASTDTARLTLVLLIVGTVLAVLSRIRYAAHRH